MPLGTLFLEATQRKTERMVTTVLRVDPKVAEAQAVGIASRRERRPAEPVVADVIQRTGAARAEARGRCRSALEGCFFLAKVSFFLSQEATQRKAVRTEVEILRNDPGVVELQAVGIAARRGRRPTVPVGADVIQLSRSSCRISIPAVAEARGRCNLHCPRAGGNLIQSVIRFE